MTYCIDFFRKFKKDGNFCGLDKSQVSRLTAYLEIVELLMKQKIPEEQIYENFTVHAAEPLIASKGEAHTDGLNFVTTSLKEGKKVTNKDVQSTLKSCSTATHIEPLPVEKRQNPSKTFSPQPGSVQQFTGLRGVHPSMQVCQDAKCPNIVARGGSMAKECGLSKMVPGNTPVCPLDLQFYYVKYPRTAACREKGCADLILQRPDLHLCKVTGIRPENIPSQRCPKDLPAEQEKPPIQQEPEGPPKPTPVPAEWKCGVPCPDGKDHTIGDKCKILAIPCKQIPQHQCPIICDPFTGGKIIKPEPYKISKSRMTDTERDELIDRLVEHTNFTPKDIEQIDEIVKVNNQGWTCRYDVIESAVMKLLAEAEGA